MCIGMKKIMMFQKGILRWDLEILYSLWQKPGSFVGGNLLGSVVEGDRDRHGLYRE